MNTGILATLTHTLPYQFHGLRIISAILYVIDLTLFVLFSIIFALRFILYPKTAWAEIVLDVNELCFTATLPISWMTLTTLTSLVVSNASWGGYSFTMIAYVMWWIGAAWVTALSIFIYLLLTQKQLTSAKNLSLAIILPAVATATVAAEGGLICIYSVGISARLAIPVIIVSLMLLGVGMFLAIFIYALFLYRILATGWFDGVRRPTLALLLGPTGQCATALMALSTASTMHFPEYGKGTFLTKTATDGLHAACVLLSLMLFGLGIFWTLYVVCGILDATAKKEVKWTPAWYSTIFPAGTMNSALILFSEAMDSPTFRVLATMWLIVLVLNTIINFGFTIRAVANRQVLVVKEDPRAKKKS